MQARSHTSQPALSPALPKDAVTLPPVAREEEVLAQAPIGGAIATALGEHITAGRVDINGTADTWTATISRLERPGVVASMFFAQGLREVSLLLDDGRTARAQIAGTSFVAASERVCQLIGLEPLT